MQDQPCCPLCHKDLNHNEVGDLETELRDKIEMLPENIRRSERSLNESKSKLEKLLGMQQNVERVEKLKSSLIPQMKEEIKKIETDLTAAQEKIKKTEKDVEEPKERSDLIGPMIGDISILEDAFRDINQTRIELEPLRRNLPSGEGQDDYDLDSLQKKRKEINDRSKILDREIARVEKQSNDEDENIRQFQETEMKLKESVLQLKSDITKRDTLKAREKDLTEEIRKLKEKKEVSDQSLIPIQGKIKHAEEKRRFKKAQNAELLSKEMKYYEGLKKDYDQIERLSKELEKLAKLNLVKEIERFKNILTKLRNEHSSQVI